MIQLTKFSLKNKAAIFIAVAVITIMGIASTLGLPMEFLPSVDNPAVTVTTFGQGMDAQSLSKNVTNPLEKQLAKINGVSTVTSSTSQGFSVINANFKNGANMKDAKKEAENIASAIQLPDGVSKPVVSQLNTSMIPIAQLTVTADKITPELESKIQNEVLPQFQAIDGVDNVMFYGKSTTEINIAINKATALHISPMQISGMLQGKNISATVGEIHQYDTYYNLRVVSILQTVDQIKALPLASHVKLSDVANVEMVTKKETTSHLNGKDAVVLVIFKKSGENSVTVGRAIDAKINELKDTYKSSFELQSLFNTATQVSSAVNSMAREVGLGALFASIVILFFLRNIRTTIIAVVSIPLSIFLTMFLLSKSGVTLNILTLGGLAVAVGRIVDDSIVVIENIYRRLQTKEVSKDEIIFSTKEVVAAITSSTLTTIAVFLPIGLVTGSIGSLLFPFAITVAYSLLSSLLVALTVIPLLSLILLKNVKHVEGKKPLRYLAALGWALSHKIIVVTICTVLFIGSLAAYFILPQNTLNADDQSRLSLNVKFPLDTHQDIVLTKVNEIEHELLGFSGAVENVYSQVGSSQDDAKYGQTTPPNMGKLTITTKKGANVDNLIDNIKKVGEKYKPAAFDIAKASFAGAGGKSITLNVISSLNDKTALIDSAQKVLDEMKKIDGLDKVESNAKEVQSEYVLTIDPNKAQLLGVNAQMVAGQIHALLGKTPIGSLDLSGGAVPIYASYLNSSQTNTNDILNAEIPTSTGQFVKVKDFASMTTSDSQSIVLRKEGKEYLTVSAEITAKDMKKPSLEINKLIKNISLPKGVSLEINGATKDQAQSFAELGKTMLLAIAIVYVIMVVTFGQARIPFVILFSLPLAAVGSILALMVTRTAVDINSLFGALMLIGIVVTNAIVLLDRVHQHKENGMSTREALLEAGSTRLRPIMMTATATICAMLPLVFGTHDGGSIVSKSLAVVVIGGLVISTALTLVVIPVVYEIFDRFGKKINKQVEA